MNVTAGGLTGEAEAETEVYFSELFAFDTAAINLIDYSPSSLRKSIAPSLTHFSFEVPLKDPLSFNKVQSC